MTGSSFAIGLQKTELLSSAPTTVRKAFKDCFMSSSVELTIPASGAGEDSGSCFIYPGWPVKREWQGAERASRNRRETGTTGERTTDTPDGPGDTRIPTDGGGGGREIRT